MASKHQPQNPTPRRRLTFCHRHPNIPVTTGLCASCLRERLSLLNPEEPSTSSSSVAGAGAASPELRRCKTFSANNVVDLSLEPRRRSCDVRVRHSLSSTLFDAGDGDSSERLQVESRKSGLLRKGTCPVSEVREEEEEEDDDCSVNCDFEVARVSDLPTVDEFEESKTMKEFIDLEIQANTKPNNTRRDIKEIAGSFWIGASVFSKKLQKWRKKQGVREQAKRNADSHGVGLGEMQLERLRGRRLKFRDTQSLVGEYGFGRRSCDTDPRGSIDFGRASIDGCAFGRMSCDTDPRFSIDLGRASIDCGRISVEEARSSFDAPRASWDEYLMGGRKIPQASAPVVSVIENAMATVYGFDHRMLAGGKMNKLKNKEEKGFDRSSSLKDMRVMEDGEAKPLSNARVSTTAIGIFDGTKLLITEKELNEWRLNSLKNVDDDDSLESFETTSKDLTSISSSSTRKDFKKSRQWGKVWSMWGLLHRRKGDKYDNEEKLERHNAECPNANPANNTRKTESKAIVRRNQEEVVLHRNRSLGHSPSHLDNGLLRFYLTPLRRSRRSKLADGRLKKSHSLARSVLGL